VMIAADRLCISVLIYPIISSKISMNFFIKKCEG
jgi:hypothetical protein